MHFLIADDDAVHRTMLCRMVESLGHTADVAEDGSEAVASTRLKGYDVVLMDIHMPTMNGYDAARAISRSATAPFVAMLTADAGGESRALGLASGASMVLTKPVRIATLRDLAEAATAPRHMPAGLGGHGFAWESHAAADVHEPPVIDLETLGRFRSVMGADDLEFLEEIESDFLADADHLIDSIEAYGERPDHVAMARAAHTLKSNAAMFGALRLSMYARAIERLADAGLPYPWKPGVARLRAELGLVVNALSAGIASD